ncbi:hypothetical protein ACJMK2_001315, partial [Sinanodonta woodiana]
KMYRLYVSKCFEDRSKPVSVSIYRRIFDREFNLAFHHPVKDQCDLCTKYKNSSDAEKLEMNEIYDNHIRNKEKSRENKSKDKEQAAQSQGEFISACFDLQEVLTTPKSFESACYYKRRLNTFSLTLYNLGNSDGYSFIWNESVSGR